MDVLAVQVTCQYLGSSAGVLRWSPDGDGGQTLQARSALSPDHREAPGRNRETSAGRLRCR